MNVTRICRWPWSLVILLCALPQLAWADPDYGTAYAVVGVFAGVVVLLLLVGVWAAVAHYRSGRPGIGVGNGILMVLAALAMLTLDSWAGLVATGYLGLSAWLLARKELRQSEQHLEWWTAVGLIGFGWLAGGLLVLVPGYLGSTYSNAFGAKVVAAVMLLVVKLPGWVPLIKQFYARQPVLWPAEAGATALRVAGRVAAVSLAVSLLQGLSTLVHPEYWKLVLPPLLLNELVQGLGVVAVMLGVAWWQQRRAAVQ